MARAREDARPREERQRIVERSSIARLAVTQGYEGLVESAAQFGVEVEGDGVSVEAFGEEGCAGDPAARAARFRLEKFAVTW